MSGIALLPVATAQSVDPEDVWLRAYTVMKEGEQFEQTGDRLSALSKFNESKKYFDAVYHEHPEFYPDIVRYRRKELADKISELRDGLKNGQTPPLVPVDPQVTPDGLVLPSHNNQPQTGPVGGSPEFAAPVQPVQDPNVVTPPIGSVTTPSLSPIPMDANNPILSLQQHYQEMKSEIDRLNQVNLSLQQQLQTREQELANYQNELGQARQREEQLRAEMEKNSGASPETVDALKRQLSEAMALAKESNNRSEQLLRELDVSRQEYAALQSERDRILRERDQLAAVVDSDAGKQQLGKLIAENERLRSDLEATREQAEQLRNDSGDKDAELVKLKAQLARIEHERSQLLADNELHQRHIAELQGHLKELGKGSLIGPPVEVASGAPVDPNAAKAVAENRMLRDIVLRQLSRQNQLKQAKDALIQQLEELGVESSSLLASIDDIVAGASLSTEEKDMIRPPSIDDAAGPKDATIIVDGSEQGMVTVQSLAEELIQIQKAARLDYTEGRFDAARIGYETYLHLNPRNVDGTCNLAQVHLQLGDFPTAEALLETAIALDKDAGRPYYLLGVVYFRQGKHDEALGQLELGLKLEPENARAHNYVGVICADYKGWRKRAEESFSKAITCDGKFADPHFNLAVLYAGGDDPDAKKAREHYAKALELGADRDPAIERFLDIASATAATSLGATGTTGSKARRTLLTASAPERAQ